MIRSMSSVYLLLNNNARHDSNINWQFMRTHYISRKEGTLKKILTILFILLGGTGRWLSDIGSRCYIVYK